MAIIGKIRERSGLLILIVGGAMVAFILSDVFSNRGPNPQDQALGEVAGEPITVYEFERRVNDEVESYRNDFGQQVDAEMTEQIRQRVWSELVRNRVLGPQAEEAGFTVLKEEYDDIRFGNNILPEFKQQPNFLDQQTGQPDRALLRQYFENVQENAPVYNSIQRDRIRNERIYTKYNTLIRKSMFVNSAQARDDFEARNEKVTFNFVAKRYDSEPDSLYTASESDIKAYYNAHKNDKKYRQKASRKFEYVVFPVVATASDRLQGKQDLEDLRNEFAASTNDSLFVVANSENRTYSAVPYAQGSADALTDSLIMKADSGEVVGPYQQGETWKLVKVQSLGDVEEARVRHILLSTQGKSADETAAISKRADSLLAVVKRDRSKFDALVTKFSEDPGSVPNGGVYEWFDRFKMVPEFTTASFDEKEGAITVAKTDYGYHIVEVLGQRTRKERRIASVDRGMQPLPPTFKEVYKKANTFSLVNMKDAEAFKAAAEEQGLEVRTTDELRSDQRFVAGLQNPGEVISWVNRAEVGDVSDPLAADDNYVIAMLTGIREEGVPELEDVRELFAREATKENKAKALLAKMEGRSDLDALAQELGVSVQTATDLTPNASSIPGGYSEFEVIGNIFSLENGQTSVPLKGETAVFVVNVTNKLPSPEISDLASEKATILQRVQGRVDNGVFNALREASGVKDERAKFY